MAAWVDGIPTAPTPLPPVQQNGANRQVMHKGGSPADTPMSSMSVFLDFDGTVTVEDTSTHLLRRLSGPGWEAPGQEYRDGRISGRTCLLREWEMLPHDLDQLIAVASEVSIDPGAEALLNLLTRAGAEVAVLSDGFGFFAEHLMGARVPVITNRVRGEQLSFPHRSSGCACAQCGVCKPEFVRSASSRGRTTVVIGDGTSDRRAAVAADVIFAKGELADWCSAQGVAHTYFTSLFDVVSQLSVKGK